MIDTDKYERHDYNWYLKYNKNTNKHEVRDLRMNKQGVVEDDHVCYLQYHPLFKDEQARNAKLIADAPKLLEFIQKIVKDWCKPNSCPKAFGKDVRQLMYEYGLITFNEETRRYEVKKND